MLEMNVYMRPLVFFRNVKNVTHNIPFKQYDTTAHKCPDSCKDLGAI